TYRNLLTVFLLCGFWHGANWTFVLWGAWHGSFLILERLRFGRILANLVPPIRWVYATLVVMGGWVLFRSRTLVEAQSFYAALAGRNGIASMGLDIHATLNPSVVAPLL